MQQEGETSLGVLEDKNWRFDIVRVNYLNLDSIKSVLFTKLESSTSQRQNKMTYKIDFWADGNLMPFRIFKSLFLKVTIQLLSATKNNSAILKMYSTSNIEQLGICSVWLKHKDKIIRCGFFVVPSDGPVLLGLLDIELLGLLKTMCKGLDQQ